MSGYISRSKLIKDVENLKDCYNGFSDTYDKACIIGLIAEQPSIEEPQKPKWIPVTERLPEKYIRVLVYSKATRMGRSIDFINADGNWYTTPKVSHWMPLPQPPEREGE